MCLEVRAVVVASAKLLPTLLALVGLFTGMDLHVSLKIGDLFGTLRWIVMVDQYLGERLGAALVCALVRLVARVDTDVLLEGRVLCERLSTSFVGAVDINGVRI